MLGERENKGRKQARVAKQSPDLTVGAQGLRICFQQEEEYSSKREVHFSGPRKHAKGKSQSRAAKKPKIDEREDERSV